MKAWNEELPVQISPQEKSTVTGSFLFKIFGNQILVDFV